MTIRFEYIGPKMPTATLTRWLWSQRGCGVAKF